APDGLPSLVEHAEGDVLAVDVEPDVKHRNLPKSKYVRTSTPWFHVTRLTEASFIVSRRRKFPNCVAAGALPSEPRLGPNSPASGTGALKRWPGKPGCLEFPTCTAVFRQRPGALGSQFQWQKGVVELLSR